MGKSILRLLLPLLGAAALVLAVIGLGRWAREALRQDDRYSLPFSAIECLPPPGPEQPDFLGEVQYLAGLPDQLRLLDGELPERLRAAFARHPWVEDVQDMRITREGVEVRLRYRRPVLAVRYAGQVRAVDRAGILLPTTADTRDLPTFPGTPTPPAGPAGTAWGDSAVEAAARAAAN